MPRKSANRITQIAARHGLRDRGDVRAPVGRVRLAERARQHTFAPERIDVTRCGVVERHAAGERAGQDEKAHQLRGPRPTNCSIGARNKLPEFVVALASMSPSVG